MEMEESLDRALAELEMLKAAYPDEVTTDITVDNESSPSFPLHCTFTFSPDSFVQLELLPDYPISSGVQISKYRCPQKGRMDAVVRAIRTASAECLEDQVEGAFACCAAGLEAWNEYELNDDKCIQEVGVVEEGTQQQQQSELPPTVPSVEWRTSEPLVDRKSSFVARACRVTSEKQVHEALYELINGNSKLQRATHNMYAYRLSEELPNGVVVKKFDNDDDGEDGAGKCLAHLLEMRGEDGVLVVVSRWYGGIKLGPKRFAHITNIARELLVKCHEEGWHKE